jgi:cystathionine beta-lyase
LPPFFENSGFGIQDGIGFDAPGFVRLNFGCPGSLLEKALGRMIAAMAKNGKSWKARKP